MFGSQTCRKTWKIPLCCWIIQNGRGNSLSTFLFVPEQYFGGVIIQAFVYLYSTTLVNQRPKASNYTHNYPRNTHESTKKAKVS